MTPELMQILTYLAIAAGGYAVRHFNLLSVVSPPTQSGTTPATPAAPSAHPVLDRILQILNQAADDALTQAAQQVVSQPAKPAAPAVQPTPVIPAKT